uniref:Uncharacterized protein n=1 Tax=Nitrosopumivirus cobalaminus TaxID=3158414 RepID=A0AAU7N444_9VIRU
MQIRLLRDIQGRCIDSNERGYELSLNDMCWDNLYKYEKTGTLPVMNTEEKEYFAKFIANQFDAAVESYERYCYNHGGFDEEAKARLAEIKKYEDITV